MVLIVSVPVSASVAVVARLCSTAQGGWPLQVAARDLPSAAAMAGRDELPSAALLKFRAARMYEEARLEAAVATATVLPVASSRSTSAENRSVYLPLANSGDSSDTAIAQRRLERARLDASRVKAYAPAPSCRPGLARSGRSGLSAQALAGHTAKEEQLEVAGAGAGKGILPPVQVEPSRWAPSRVSSQQ